MARTYKTRLYATVTLGKCLYKIWRVGSLYRVEGSEFRTVYDAHQYIANMHTARYTNHYAGIHTNGI